MTHIWHMAGNFVVHSAAFSSPVKSTGQGNKAMWDKQPPWGISIPVHTEHAYTDEIRFDKEAVFRGVSLQLYMGSRAV